MRGAVVTRENMWRSAMDFWTPWILGGFQAQWIGLPSFSHSEFFDEELLQSSGGVGRVSTRTDARHYALGVSATQICINGAELASKFLVTLQNI